MSAPDPQNHPLDAALRAQAERRRAELPPVGEMPGPMRAALQREVAREHSAAPAHRAETWLDKLFRWQSLFATAATAVLTIGLFAWSQGWWAQPQRMPLPETAAAPAPAPAALDDALAKRKEAPPGLDRPAAAPAPVVRAQPVTEAGEKKQDFSPPRPPPTDLAEDRRKRDEPDLAAPRTAPAKPAAVLDERPIVQERGAGKREAQDKLAGAPPAPAAPAARPRARPPEATGSEPAPSGRIVGGMAAAPPAAPAPVAPVAPVAPAAAKAGDAKSFATTTTGVPVTVQRFVQAPGQQATRQLQQRAMGPASTVLTDFTIRQTGNAIVLTDRDGSEFRGEILSAAAAQNSRRSLTQNALVNRAAKDASQMNGSYAFRVTGVSKTLGQSVVIEAEVEAEPAAPRLALDADGAAKPSGPSTQVQDQLGNNASANTKYRQETRGDQGSSRGSLASDRRLRFYGEVRGEREVVEVEAVGE